MGLSYVRMDIPKRGMWLELVTIGLNEIYGSGIVCCPWPYLYQSKTTEIIRAFSCFYLIELNNRRVMITKSKMNIEYKRKSTLFNFKSRIMKMRFGLTKDDRRSFDRLNDKLRTSLHTNAATKVLYNKLHKYVDMTNEELWESDILELFRSK